MDPTRLEGPVLADLGPRPAAAAPPDGPPPNDTEGDPRTGGHTSNSTGVESGASSKRPRSVLDRASANKDDDVDVAANGTDDASSPPPANARAVTPYAAPKGRTGSLPPGVVSEARRAFWEHEKRYRRVVADLAAAAAAAAAARDDDGRPQGGGEARPAEGGAAVVPPQSGGIGTPLSTTTAQQMQSHWAVAQVAREKAEEVLLLQRQLAQAQAQISAMDAANGAIRQANEQLQVRLEKTAHALRIAGKNASKAQKDATDAEATALALAARFEAFETAVTETKESARALGEDQRHVTDRAHSVEMQLVHALAREATVAAKCRELETRTSVAEAKLHDSTKAEQGWRGRYESSQESLHDLQVQLDRAHSLQEGRRAHTDQLTKDLQQTVALLEASSRTNQESEEALRQLQEANRQLEEHVESQATELSDLRLKSQRDKGRLNEAYTKALSKAQQLEMQLEMYKATAAAKEDEWKHERKRLLSALNAAKGAPSTMATAPPAPAEGGMPAASGSMSVAARIPKLSSMGRSPSTTTTSTTTSTTSTAASDHVSPMNPSAPSAGAASTGPKCCVCSKPATYGVIKTCQCGRDKCFQRAHAACASIHASAFGAGSDPRLILCGVGGGGDRGGDEPATGSSRTSGSDKESDAACAADRVSSSPI